jgi:hypothetical protein
MIADGLVVVLRQCARENAFETEVSPQDLAGAIARTAMSHYIFPESGGIAARQQIRAAAGLPARRQ